MGIEYRISTQKMALKLAKSSCFCLSLQHYTLTTLPSSEIIDFRSFLDASTTMNLNSYSMDSEISQVLRHISLQSTINNVTITVNFQMRSSSNQSLNTFYHIF